MNVQQHIEPDLRAGIAKRVVQIILLMVIRTALEDSVLDEELLGYEAYAQ